MGGTVFMELDQPKLVFTILCQRVHSSREPVPLLPEQVDFCLQGLDVSPTIFVVLAKRIRKSISVMYYALEFLLCLSMVFYDFLQLIHQATVGNLLFLTLTLFPTPGFWHATLRFCSKFRICRLQKLQRVQHKASALLFLLTDFLGCSQRVNNSLNQLINLAPGQRAQ